MAGAYPNAPGRRLAYDDDGTVGLRSAQANGPADPGDGPTVAYTNATATLLTDMNDEDYASGETFSGTDRVLWLTLLLAELHELDGVYYIRTSTGAYQGDPRGSVAYSTNTTNGYDGTWTDLVTGFDNASTPADHYRDNIDSKAISNVTGIMAKSQADTPGHNSLHLYMPITPGETPDRILFLDPDDSDNEFTRPLDFGDVPRGQTQQDTVKLKNNSGTLTANTLQVTADDLFGGAASWYTFSDDDIVYVATLGLGNVGPGGTELVHVKQIVPDAQVPGVYSARMKANVASWT